MLQGIIVQQAIEDPVTPEAFRDSNILFLNNM